MLKLDILLRKVKSCFLKKTKQKEQKLDVPALYYCLEVVPTDGKVPFCAQPANLLLDILNIAQMIIGNDYLQKSPVRVLGAVIDTENMTFLWIKTSGETDPPMIFCSKICTEVPHHKTRWHFSAPGPYPDILIVFLCFELDAKIESIWKDF